MRVLILEPCRLSGVTFGDPELLSSTKILLSCSGCLTLSLGAPGKIRVRNQNPKAMPACAMEMLVLVHTSEAALHSALP